MGYHNISSCYDIFTRDIDYRRWADYIEDIFARYDKSPELLLDLACGTGNLTEVLCERGYNMTGIDISEDMLNIAYEKSRKQGWDILYLCQDMSAFELYGTVDGILCCLDGLNCLIDQQQLSECFRLVNLYLNPGSLFIFDVNTRYKMEHVLADNTFVYESKDEFCVWENTFHTKKNICDFYLTFFTKNESGLYERSEDRIRERGYSIRQLSSSLKNAGLEILDVFDEFSFEAPKNESQRVFFIAQKKQ